MNVLAHVLWSVANSVWQGALIAALAATALRLARRTSAALRYSVWSGVLLAAALLPAINFLAPERVVSVDPAASLSFRLHAIPAVDSTDVARRAQLGASLHTSPSSAQRPPAAGGTQSVRYAITAVSIDETAMQRAIAWSRPAAASASAWISGHAWMALLGWALVSSLLLVRLGIGFAKLRTIKNGLVTLRDEDILATCDSSSRSVTVGASDDVECPCVIGYARPVVALPAALVDELDRSDLRRVLAHELGHIRRWDDWANLAQQIVRAVWFFNPVVHLACRALDVDREIACDDIVAAGHSDRLEYAKCLTEIARRTTFAEHLVPAAGFFPDRRQIVVRIEQLLDRDHLGSARVGAVPVASAAILVVIVAALARYQVPAFAMAPPVAPVAPAPLVAALAAMPTKAVTPAKPVTAHAAPVALKTVPVRAVVPAQPERKVSVELAKVKMTNALMFKTATTSSDALPGPLIKIASPAMFPKVTVELALPRYAPVAIPRDKSLAPAVSASAVVSASGAVVAKVGLETAKSSEGDFLDALAEAGYTRLTVDELISIRNAGITPSYLRSLKQFGITPMPVSKLIALANAGVDADFIATMHAAGYSNLSADDLVSLSNAGVTSLFVRSMAATGHARPSPRELISLANAGVSPSYVAILSKNGYSGLSVDSLISLANAGVTALYIVEMAKQGYTKMSVDSLTALANAGVSPSYVKSLADVGYANVSTDDLIRMANAGVTSKLITTLRSHGIGDKTPLSVDELIKLANEGF